ncbi:unnamed protein product [Peniophora sp. CBMAI 1063]|nr:unnamed protein product [Peniophora sp. CBMAI 1063]
MTDNAVPASSEPGSEFSDVLLVQTKLEQYGFTALPRKPCWINLLMPPELIMEILAYLPLGDSFSMTRVHTNPSNIPVHHSDCARTDEHEADYYDIRISVVQEEGDYGNCIAGALFPNGCYQYCSSGYWNYLDVLRVCRFWHSSAESSPSFWTHIPSQSLNTVHRSLKLSGALPLFIVADDDRHWPSSLAFTTALNSLPRICVLDITYVMKLRKPGARRKKARWDMHNVLDAFTKLGAPALQALSLLHWNAETLTTEQWVEKHFPSLEVVNISSLRIAHPCKLLVPTLTELRLTDCVGPWDNVDQLLRSLARMQHLRVLDLQGTVLPADLDLDDCPLPADLATPVSFISLRYLGLEGSFRCVNRLLSMLSVPPGKTSLYISFVSGWRPEDHGDRTRTSDFISSFPATMPRGAYFTSIDLDLDFSSRIIELNLSELHNPATDPCAEDIQLRLEWHGDEDVFCGQMMRFLRAMVDTSIAASRQTCVLYNHSGSYRGNDGPGLGPDKYLSSLARLTDVTVVRLSSEKAASLFFHWMTKRRRRGQGALPFPAPERVSLYNADLRSETFYRRTAARPEHGILYAQLWHYLHHFRTQSLSLSTVTASPRMLAELKRLVPSLDIYSSVRRAQERERCEVRQTVHTQELLYIYGAKKGDGSRQLSRIVSAPRTRMFWEWEDTVVAPTI